MCVAVIIQSKNRVPLNHLKAMHEANSDGAGVAWMDGEGCVQFRKGLTVEQIDEMQDSLPRPFLMHFRIATRGDKIPELTHPFPIGPQAFDQELSGKSEKGVLIHNGTWSDFHKFVPGGLDLPQGKISDTQVAAYMAAIDEDILDNVKWSNAIMKPDGVWYRGNWEKFEGNLYSNLYWRRELWRTENWSFYGRTVTPFDVRKRGAAHRENHNQENGRTVGQYQTQFSKSGGGAQSHKRGQNTIQSNGKTIAENREAKRNKRSGTTTAKTQPMGTPIVSYENAVKAYNDNKGNWQNPNPNPDAKTYDGERLFSDNELPGYYWNGEGRLTYRGTRTEREVVNPSKSGKSVKCPDCKQEIVKIPCGCEESLEVKIEALELEELTGMDPEECLMLARLQRQDSETDSKSAPIGMDEVPLTDIDDWDNIPTIVRDCRAGCTDCGPDEKCGLDEDMNANGVTEDLAAYGMGLALDAGGGDCYLDPEFGEANEACKLPSEREIKEQGIKVSDAVTE